MTRSVGFIGLGNIGKPMARRLSDWPAGLWVCDVDPAAVAALEADGAKVAATPRDVAEHAGFISVMVRDDAQVRTVISGDDGILAGADPGTVIAVHSTIHPDTVAELAELAVARGVHILDAPVSGGAGGAAQGKLAIMVGGERLAFDLARPVLERMGELVVHLGPAGAGTATKLARNMLHFTAFVAAMEASALAQAAGVDLVTLGKIVRHTDAVTGGPGAIMYRDRTGPVAIDDPWRPILEHVRALGEKDLSFALELAQHLDVEAPVARLALDRLAVSLGVGSSDD
ncbi:MAG TPA: NAD(P)-dependent oxidoreductase [Jatrophihabitantaceae bacterium]|jgi:3-hydroxyisobutyrate dehydrogenase